MCIPFHDRVKPCSGSRHSGRKPTKHRRSQAALKNSSRAVATMFRRLSAQCPERQLGWAPCGSRPGAKRHRPVLWQLVRLRDRRRVVPPPSKAPPAVKKGRTCRAQQPRTRQQSQNTQARHADKDRRQVARHHLKDDRASANKDNLDRTLPRLDSLTGIRQPLRVAPKWGGNAPESRKPSGQMKR